MEVSNVRKGFGWSNRWSSTALACAVVPSNKIVPSNKNEFAALFNAGNAMIALDLSAWDSSAG